MDPEYFSEELLTRYGKTGYRFPEVLKKYSNQELALRAGLSEKTIARQGTMATEVSQRPERDYSGLLGPFQRSIRKRIRGF